MDVNTILKKDLRRLTFTAAKNFFDKSEKFHDKQCYQSEKSSSDSSPVKDLPTRKHGKIQGQFLFGLPRARVIFKRDS